MKLKSNLISSSKVNLANLCRKREQSSALRIMTTMPGRTTVPADSKGLGGTAPATTQTSTDFTSRVSTRLSGMG